MKASILILGVLFVIASFSSCADPKHLTYLQGSFDTAQLSKVAIQAVRIQKGDLIDITVHSDNISASAPFNLQNTPTLIGQSASIERPSASYAQSYLVDADGNIQFPIIGSLHIEGLTKKELIRLLDEKLKPYLSNPFYNIRFMNYKITLIGEVNKPGVYSVPNEKINLLEALGLAGDLTFYGRRDNILIVREFNGRREWGRLDLRDPNIVKSAYFQLQQNDVVIVEMNRKKISVNDQTLYRNVSIGTSIVSVLAIVYTAFIRR